jgi:streptomycin 6-kinase
VTPDRRYARDRSSSVPILDVAVRQRLTKRFGAEIGSWLSELPDVLSVLAERWHLEWGSLIPRGSMSVVIRCTVPDGRSAVLKASPDRTRLATEAAALAAWTTGHTPSVIEVDETVGALLIEAIEPGTPLVGSSIYPDLTSTADLLTSLHVTGDPSYPSLVDRVAHLFDSGASPYQRRPELLDVVPRDLYERGHDLATRIAAGVPPTALLHGDLTPSNVLDGGAGRGLVAIDPAPCLGDDMAFDAIDLLLWQADDVDTISGRVEVLAPTIGSDPTHLFEWCTAFGAMAALELAESIDADVQRVRTYLALAALA